MVFSQFFILSSRGDVIISRDFRGDINKTSPEIFFGHAKRESSLSPYLRIDDINYVHCKLRGLYFILTSRSNVSPSFTAALLKRLTEVFKDYCGVVSEEAIRANFVLIYELLDEMLDFGYPQETSSEHLKGFIYNEPVLTDASPSSFIPAWMTSLPTIGKTRPSVNTNKPIAWDTRSQRATKNEIFVDLIERLNVIFNSNGSILKSEIDGCIRMKSYLRGQPELKLALNEDLVIGRQAQQHYGAAVVDDITFHQACILTMWESQRTVTLQAPEGECVALNYRISQEFDLPFRVIPYLELIDPCRVDLVIKVRADIPGVNVGSNVVLRVPMPRRASSVTCVLPPQGAEGQSAEYRSNPDGSSDQEQSQNSQVVWTIKKFAGQTQHQLRVRISLSSPSPQIRQEIGPIFMDFEIPMFNVSNVQIRFLRIVERSEGYKPQRWVRLITQAATYVCRLGSNV